MPLLKSASKKALQENIESEMKANPGADKRAQNLAIAFSTQRAAKKRKKMAKGGSVENESSAKYESRPSPDKDYNDSSSISRNSGDKSLKNSDWLDRSTVEQAQRPSPHKLSRPEQRGSDSFSSRHKSEIDKDNDRLASEQPESPDSQPSKSHDEEGADRHGPDLSDNERQHNNRRPAYARGGRVDMEPQDHDLQLMEREDELDMQDRLAPGEHGEQPKRGYDEESSPMRESGIDRSKPHSRDLASAMYAKGGEVNPELEQSVLTLADKIMEKRMYADGGMVDLDEESEEHPNKYYDLNIEAAGKEQYDDEQLSSQPLDSNEKGDSIEHDKHDMIDKIRAKMKRQGRGMMP